MRAYCCIGSASRAKAASPGAVAPSAAALHTPLPIAGVSHLVANADLRRSNGLSPNGEEVVVTWVDPELRSGFHVRYANDETAEASWEFVKEEAG